MEDQYWLRHPSLQGHIGPLGKKELRQAIDAGAFPYDSMALRDEGQTEAEREDRQWIPVTAILGIPPPPVSMRAAHEQGATGEPMPPMPSDRLEHLRVKTAYPNTRALITIGMILLLVAELILTGVSMKSGQFAGHGALALATGFIQIMVTVIVGNVLLAILDLADSSVRQYPHPRDK